MRNLFSTLARALPIDWSNPAGETPADDRRGLQHNFAAIVLNGLFFPTAGKILGAGLLLTWFLSELTASAFVIAIQYGFALLAQPWIGQWMSAHARPVRYHRNQALVRGGFW